MNQHIHQPLPSAHDRLAARAEPAGIPLLHQDWLDLLFLHWSVDPIELSKLLPNDVEVDLFKGRAWIGITPFRIEHLSPGVGPRIGVVPSFYELNVRTYVYRAGLPAVWFFSLDAGSQLAVWAARLGYRLPYFHAEITSSRDGDRLMYHHQRLSEPRAAFEVSCRIDGRLAPQHPGSFEFWAVERYALLTERDGNLYLARIHHQPWPLYGASVDSIWTTLFEAEELPILLSGPIAHFSPGVNADIWRPEIVRPARRYH